MMRARAAPTGQDSSAGDRAFYVLFATAAAIALGTFRDYGYSWDETLHNFWYGEVVWRFLSGAGRAEIAAAPPTIALYGGLYDLVGEAAVRTGLLPPGAARHFVNAVTGLLGVWGCRAVARQLGGPWAGFWAALLLLTAPSYYGHMFINAKDIPFAVGSTWFLFFLLRWIRVFPDVPWRLRLGLALALGASLGVRVGGVVSAGYALLVAGADVAIAAAGSRGRLAAGWERARRWIALLVPVFAAAYLLMIVAWPAAALHPLSVPLEALRVFGKFAVSMEVRFEGSYLPSTALPRRYVPVMLAVVLPEAFLVLGAAALVWGPWDVFRAARRGDFVRVLSLGLLMTAMTFPLLWAVATRATIFDNLRHFLFVLPPAAALAALGWTRLLRALSPRKAAVAVMALALFLGTQVSRMAALHPYEYAFLSVFGGGMPAGARRFETEYWLTSYREAAARMVAHARSVAASEGVPFEQCRFVVTVTGNVRSVEIEVPRNFEVVAPRQWPPDPAGIRGDYLVSTTRWGWDEALQSWPVVAEVGRAGMRFAVVRANPALLAPLSPSGI